MGEILGNAYDVVPPILIGVWGTLYGYGVIPGKTPENEEAQKKADKLKDLFRWAGPVSIVIGFVLIAGKFAR